MGSVSLSLSNWFCPQEVPDDIKKGWNKIKAKNDSTISEMSTMDGRWDAVDSKTNGFSEETQKLSTMTATSNDKVTELAANQSNVTGVKIETVAEKVNELGQSIKASSSQVQQSKTAIAEIKSEGETSCCSKYCPCWKSVKKCCAGSLKCISVTAGTALGGVAGFFVGQAVSTAAYAGIIGAFGGAIVVGGVTYCLFSCAKCCSDCKKKRYVQWLLRN